MINALIILYILRYVPECPLWVYLLLVIEFVFGMSRFIIVFLSQCVKIEIQDEDRKNEQ